MRQLNRVYIMRSFFSHVSAILILILLMPCTPAFAQFGEVVQVSDGATTVLDPSIYVDQNCLPCAPQQVSICARTDNEIYFTGSVLDFQPMFSVLTSSGEVFSPALAQGTVASYSITLEQEFASGPHSVFLIESIAAGFGDPVLVSSGSSDCFDSSVIVLDSGDRVITWTRSAGTSDELMMKFSDQSPFLCGTGGKSRAISVSGNTVVIIWQAGTVLNAMVSDASSQGATFVLYDLLSPIDQWDGEVQSDGSIQLVADVSDELHLLTGSIFDGISSQQILSTGAGEITDVAIGSSGADRYSIAWIQNQQTHRYAVSGTAPPVSGPIEGIAGNHSEMDLALDAPGNEHFVVISDSGSWYAHTTPPPVADFTVTTKDDGIADHTIIYEDHSVGLVENYLWDFGDGDTSTTLVGEHTYLEPGSYTITLTVSGPGGSDTMELPNPITVDTPENAFELADIAVFAGQPVIHPVLGTHVDCLQGFQISVAYDEAVINMTEISIENTLAESLAPEFIASSINPGGSASSLYLAVIFDTLPPFDGRMMSPGLNQTLCTLNYTVVPSTPLGTVTELHFADDLVIPPINNIYAIEGGFAVLPYYIQGTVTVSQQPQFLFHRGDATYDQSVNIADAIFILDFLFITGSTPVCPDSADTNDDGLLNIGDAINLLSFLFIGGATLPYPYPGYGIDPTPDSLGACLP
ncbi:MAG: PKD domain-containing protein [Planctomycetota bacterium]|nr:PKD domain-containing protein [Planctomycetota bacterium]